MNDFEEEDIQHIDTPEPEAVVKPVISETTVDDRIDPRLRPADPAGTKPRVDPDSLLPENSEPLLRSAPVADVDAEGEEVPLDADDGGDLLPTRRPIGSPALATASVPSEHAGRFGFALGALLAIAAAGIALAALAISHRNDTGPPRPFWSTWTPVKDGGDGPTQIAQHIAPLYRLATGRQMVLVTSSPLKVEGVSLDVAKVGATNKDPIKVVKGNKTVMFRMCGLDKDCAIPGTPSVNRAFLVRREALELALYTFQYTDANGVVVLFPPIIESTKKSTLTPADVAKAAKKRVAAFFQRKQLADLLKRPVTSTLTRTTPSVATATNSPDALTVKDKTASSLYTFGLTSGNTENKGYLVLSKG